MIIWAGGELSDFGRFDELPAFDAITDDPSTLAVRRTALTRSAIRVRNARSTASCIAALPALPDHESPILLGTPALASLTEFWLSAQIYVYALAFESPIIGLASDSFGLNGLSFGIGTFAASGSPHGSGALWLVSDSGISVIAAEDGHSFDLMGLRRVDMHVSGIGGDGHVEIYINGTQVLDDDVDIDDLDPLSYVCIYGVGATHSMWLSEIIVADEDTRQMSVATLVPDDEPAFSEWSGDGDSLNERPANTSNVISTNDADQQFRIGVTGMPSGSFDVRAVRVSAFSAALEQSNIRLGANGVVGEDVPVDEQWGAYDRVMNANPVTEEAWTADQIPNIELTIESGDAL